MIVIGIDPGMSGALAAVRDGELVDVIDCPVAGEGASRRVNVCEVRDWIAGLDGPMPIAYIEAAGAMPGQGVSGMFRYGRSVGAVEAVVGCCGVRLEVISASSWKKAMLLRGGSKEDSRAKAVRLWPGFAESFARKCDHGRAEAALIARAGWLMETTRGGMQEVAAEPLKLGPTEGKTLVRWSNLATGEVVHEEWVNCRPEDLPS